MGLLSRLRAALPGTAYKMVVDVGNGFYSWDGKLYQSDIVRACIKPKTKAIGKAIAKHVRTTIQKDGKKEIAINPEASIRFLLEEPNDLMTGQMLQEKVANQLQLNNNAFILVMRDSFGNPIGLFPIPAAGVETIYSDNGDLSLKFYYMNGKYSVFPYSDIIHLRDDFFYNDIFGEAPQQALTNLMETVTIVDQGIVNAIKNSGVVRWLLKFTKSLRPEDLKVEAENFAKNYLSISNNSVGVAATDAKAEAQQVEPHDYVPNAAQSDRLTQRIYAFFNTNQKIVTSSYTEDEWISYYEQCIEPVIMQMKGEYTRKIFSRRQRGCGNEIMFDSGDLTFSSMATKMKLVQMVDRRIMSPNEVRHYLNLPPVYGGDEMLLRKDTERQGTK